MKKIIGISLAIVGLAFFLAFSSIKNHPNTVRIPISFSPNNGKPTIDLGIEGHVYSVLLDTGATCEFSLQSKILDTIANKREAGAHQWQDINGNYYKMPIFALESINIGKNIKIPNALVTEENFKFINSGVKIHSPLEPIKANDQQPEILSGLVGLKTLRRSNYWLIDFPKSSLVLLKDLEKIKSDPLSCFGEFTEVKLESTSTHLVISVDTDFGTQKFALDTGADISVFDLSALEPFTEDLKNSSLDLESFNHQFMTFKKFEINKRNFGDTQLFLFNFPKELGKFNGILGRDFFLKHSIYLDFKNNRAYIGPTQNLPLSVHGAAQCNSTGFILRPEQPNRAFAILEGKLYQEGKREDVDQSL